MVYLQVVKDSDGAGRVCCSLIKIAIPSILLREIRQYCTNLPGFHIRVAIAVECEVAIARDFPVHTASREAGNWGEYFRYANLDQYSSVRFNGVGLS